jgi:hypothetical protein
MNIILLKGDLPSVTMTGEANKMKSELLSRAGSVKLVSTQAEYDIARMERASVKSMLAALEESRKAVTAPFLAKQREIMESSKAFAKELETEDARIKGLQTMWADEQEKLRLEAVRKACEEEERLSRIRMEAEKKARDEELARELAEQARLDAEAALQKAAEESGTRNRMNARKAAMELEKANEERRQAEAAARLAAEKEAEAERSAQRQLSLSQEKVKGASQKLDYEIVHIKAAYEAEPTLFVVTPRRQELLFQLNRGKVIPGVRTFRTTNIR